MPRLTLALGCAAALLLGTISIAQPPAGFPPGPLPDGVVVPDVPPPIVTPVPVPPPAAPGLVQPSWLVTDPGALTAEGFASGQYGAGGALPPGKTMLIPGCNTDPGPTYLVTTDALLWRLEHMRRVPVIANWAGAVIAESDVVDLGLSAGPRVNVAYVTEEGNTFEVNYFGFYNWSGQRNYTSLIPDLRLPDTFGTFPRTVDYFFTDHIQLDYTAHINSVELNLTFASSEDRSFQVLIGPRFMRLDEAYIITSYPPFIAPGVPPGVPPRYQSYFQVTTRNELWGAQMGGRWRRCRGRWEWVTEVKTAVCTNKARQNTFVTDLDRTVLLRDTSPGQDVAAFIGDFNLTLNYQLNCWWWLRFGYSCLWMQGIARAPDQFDFSTHPGASGAIFFREALIAHGFNCGFERRW